MKFAPCKGCSDRHDNCHSTCSSYKEFVEYKAAQKAALYEERKADTTRWQTFNEFKQQKIRKTGKW